MSLPGPDAVIRTVAEQAVITSPVMTTVIVAPGSTTEQEYGLFEVRLSPGAPGALPHYHEGFSESFYVLSGRLAVRTGDLWTSAGSGDLVRVPRRGVHAFRPDGDDETRFLILFTPAGQPREEYFAEMAALADRDVPPTTAEIDAIALRHDQVNLR
ncbi:cupin domain-containing protein [Pseudonocardia abyssalis]|jgi:quercetin dioxygenase-like cupin family protein|uniref:Cupin domain-containing protein n=1 Tax=Pseudonocardia abyssalis TaxID=2792008 RepID=A0ABS6UZD0_9PSEU|nr:cupin domain-containing protein [Pseudonocardia abyssalis]MBW0117177.1 cupin domain-containing protein [Pseudonocardia abyssalis]MBW0137598.1 cupin domain-containing protein [Pseudonocardia abyssalis]